MRAIKGLFFDLDGTLCDTDEANFAAYAAAFRDENVHITREEFSKTVGLSSAEFIPKLMPKVTPEAVQRIQQNKKIYYPQNMHLVEPKAEIINFLRLMKPLHLTALVTTAQKDNARHVLGTAGIQDMFEISVFGNDVERLKPAPDAYLKALELSGLEPSDVIAFEDSDAGVQAATAAGIKVIRVAAHAS